ncbi:TPA_asm: M [Plectranthus aromaticus virus 1]|uniref:M n=1 Tax=Plectranthus aromaticus virus 1 TaxID=2793738 RepID=A0A8D9PGR1_9RHAB|nr:M [Plectranthus aromaticus virus 1] [Plectranthus aromaticus virus 1]DAF42300.1 TPA_asm: M [Plectranthus aromaticus virus 1]
MRPASFSVKGSISMTFRDKKEGMTSNTIWNLIVKIWEMYPERVSISFSSTRGAPDSSPVLDPLTISAIQKMIQGSICTYSKICSVGRSMNLILGECSRYTITFGTQAHDTGHETILLTLPFGMKGCYKISASVDNYIKKDKAKEFYIMMLSLDIYIGELDDKGYEDAARQGMKVYPFMIEHPEFFSMPETSDSDGASDPSEDKTGETALKKKKKIRQLRPKQRFNKRPGLSPSSAPAKKILNALRLAGNRIRAESPTSEEDEKLEESRDTAGQMQHESHNNNPAPP